MDRLKTIIAILFLVIGLITAFLTYNLSNTDSFGRIESKTPRSLGTEITTTTICGFDSPNDGVAIGLGIISGFSFLSSVLLLTSIKKTKELI